MAKFSDYATDPVLVREGRVIPWRGPITLRIARWMNPRHEEAFLRLCEPHRQAIRDRTMDPAVMERISAEAAAEGLLLGWDGVEKDDGTPDAYTVERARELLVDPENEELYRFVVVTAQNEAGYRKAAQEAARKNLPPS